MSGTLCGESVARKVRMAPMLRERKMHQWEMLQEDPEPGDIQINVAVGRVAQEVVFGLWGHEQVVALYELTSCTSLVDI